MTTDLTLTPGPGEDGTARLTAAGEIDMSNADRLAAALADAAQGSTAILLDLLAVEYIDSAGLAALFPHVDRLRLVAGPLIAPVLTVAGLDDITDVRP